jgi:hypothetical protein
VSLSDKRGLVGGARAELWTCLPPEARTRLPELWTLVLSALWTLPPPECFSCLPAVWTMLQQSGLAEAEIASLLPQKLWKGKARLPSQELWKGKARLPSQELSASSCLMPGIKVMKCLVWSILC